MTSWRFTVVATAAACGAVAAMWHLLSGQAAVIGAMVLSLGLLAVGTYWLRGQPVPLMLTPHAGILGGFALVAIAEPVLTLTTKEYGNERLHSLAIVVLMGSVFLLSYLAAVVVTQRRGVTQSAPRRPPRPFVLVGGGAALIVIGVSSHLAISVIEGRELVSLVGSAVYGRTHLAANAAPGLLTILPPLVVPGAGLLVAGTRRLGTRAWATSSVLVTLAAAFMLLSGGRFAPLGALFAALGSSLSLRRDMRSGGEDGFGQAQSASVSARRRLTAWGSLVLLGLAAVALSIGSLRGTKDSDYRSLPVATRATEAAAGSLSIGNTLARVLSHRERTGEADLLWGTSFLQAPLRPIPRVVWPDKPMSPTLTVIFEATDPGEGQAIPMFGEWFINFSWFGVVANGAGLGWIMATICRRWASDEGGRILLVITVPLAFMAMSRGLFESHVVDLGIVVLLAWLPMRRA